MKKVTVLLILVFINLYVFPCSTFQFHSHDCLVVAHNLDFPLEVPGSIFINPRGIHKESFSWSDDIVSKLAVNLNLKKINWISKYASITYNTCGQDLIDGGMNEKGLYIGEMTLSSSSQSKDKKIKFYPPLWMQYCLDNYSTTSEVIASLNQIKPAMEDGFSWHYFVTDKNGNACVIEYLSGDVKIYTGNALSQTILCNEPYLEETIRLNKYQGFGGKEVFNRSGNNFDDRFVKIAVRNKDIISSSSKLNLIDEAFELLSDVSNSGTQWSIVFDIQNLKMFFKSKNNTTKKEVIFNDFDFQKIKNPLYVDINIDSIGNIRNRFQELDTKNRRALIQRTIESIFYSLDKESQQLTISRIEALISKHKN